MTSLGGPVVKSSPSNTEGAGLIPCRELRRVLCGQKVFNTKQKQYCNKLNKDFKMAHIKKKLKSYFQNYKEKDL